MLEVEVVGADGAVICIPKGSLDATTVATFRGAVALCLGGPGLIIDLTGVDFLDGAGLTGVVGAVRRAQDQRTRVAAVVPAGKLRKMLDETGLDLLVSMSETVELAWAEINNNATSPGSPRSSGSCGAGAASTSPNGGLRNRRGGSFKAMTGD